MYLYNLSNNFTSSNIDDIKNDTYHNTIEHVCYENLHKSNNYRFNRCIGVIPKDDNPHILNFCAHDTSYQENNHEGDLLPPDIFKLTQLAEPNLSSKQPYTSRALKRQYIEDESILVEPNPKRIDLKKNTEEIITASNLKNIGQAKKYLPKYKIPEWQIIKKEIRVKLYRCDNREIMCAEKTCNALPLTSTEHITAKNTFTYNEPLSITQNPRRVEPEKISINKNAIKKNIRLRSYHNTNLWHIKSNSRIVYIDAIKKIGIDNNGSFRRIVLKKMGKIIERRNLLKSSINLSQTYSNIRKYILNNMSSLFEDDTVDSGILISPGMSISDLRAICISNSMFFKKLREYCKKIKKDIRVTPNNNLSSIFQSTAIFNINDPKNSTNIKIGFYSKTKKDKFIPDLKELIIDTVSNLPNSIACEIDKIDQKNIVNSLFSDVHGVLASKSLIKNMSLLFASNRHEFEFANKRFDDNLNLFNNLLEKIANIVKKSCIFHDGVFLPDEPTVEQLSRYIFADMYGVSSKFHKKLKLFGQNIPKPRRSIDNIKLKSNCTKDVTTSGTRNTDPSKKKTMTKEFSLKKPYRKTNLPSSENTSNIYEYAIKKISIDNNCQFKNSVLEELGDRITNRGLTKSSINLSTTYSNVRKYVLDKISPYISDAITTTNVLINPGMFLSDLAYNCVSNRLFFEKLSRNCEEIVKNIKLVPSNYFLSIIQSPIYFNPPELLFISHKQKNKLCSAIKLLITETISNLPDNIIHELKKLNPNEIITGLFVNIHNVHLQKSLIRKLELIFNSNKLPNDKFISNLNFLNNLLRKIFIEVESHSVLHEEKTFFPGKHTAKLLSKYLLSDMYSVSAKIHKKLTLHKHTKDFISESNYEKSSATNNNDNMKISLLKKPLLIPQKKLKWDNDPVSPLYIYKLALSGIDIDKSDLECSLIDKAKHYRSVTKHLSSEKEKIDIDISITCNHVKNYILETFSPFLKEIEEETRSKIKLTNGMTIDELRLSYASNEEFLDKLREFCNKVIISIKNCSNSTLIDLIQLRIPLGTETSKKIIIIMNKERKNSFLNEMKNLLITNISNVPKTIVESIKLVPNTDIINGCFSNFYDMYVDNESLLKAKLIFDTIILKVINDPLLSESVDKISLDKTDKIRKQNLIKIRSRRIINRNLICGKLSIYSYIKKLVEKEFPTLKNKLSDPILTIRNNKIETADQKTRDEIFDKLGSDLIDTTVISYIIQ